MKPQTPLTLEGLLTRKVGFDLDTASPLQRAITRAADGMAIADALDDVACKRHFGCKKSQIGLYAPTLVALVCGVRSGKSLLAGCAATKGCLTANLDALKRHERARFAIVAPTVDNAEATFTLLTGAVQTSPALARMVVGQITQDTLVLRRPDGRMVEIVVVAAHRGAVTLRSRWLAGFVFDEVALFGAEASGSAVNAEELLRAGETRLVPGAQGWLISSPFGPEGLLFDLYKAHFGKPGRVLVVHAPTPAMNPSFPLSQIEAVRARTPDVAAREYDATWLDADTAFFDGALIDKAVRTEPLERQADPSSSYLVTMDAAARGNSWTIVVSRIVENEDEIVGVEVALAEQWTGSRTAPLDPDVVFRQIAQVIEPYGASEIDCDAWAIDPLRACARRAGLTLREHTLTAEQKVEVYRSVETLLRTGRLELPPHEVLVRDLRAIRKKALANAIRVDLPRTADGRHADFGPSLGLSVWLSMQNQTPEWLRAMTVVEARGGKVFGDDSSEDDAPRLQVERTMSIFEDEFYLHIDGFEGQAAYRPGERAPRLSVGAMNDRAFKARITEWWSETFGYRGIARRMP